MDMRGKTQNLIREALEQELGRELRDRVWEELLYFGIVGDVTDPDQTKKEAEINWGWLVELCYSPKTQPH